MTIKEYVHVFKRFIITFLLCLPIFILIGVLLQGKIHNGIMIAMFVVIGGIAFAVEELWYSKHKKKQELLREKAKLKRQYLKNQRLEKSLEKQKQDQQKSKEKNNHKKRDNK